MNSARRKSRGGMLLFEVMLATAIFCLVGIALSDGLGRAAGSMRRANRENQVRLGLASHLAEAQALPVQLGLRQEKADAEGVAYEREWKAVRLVGRDKTVLPNLYLLTVRARWNDHGEENVEEAAVRLYRPQS